MKKFAAPLALLFAAALSACAPGAPPAAQADGPPRFTGGDAIAIGRQVVIMGGCNDCHTHGFPEGGGVTPESEWLKGNPIGQYGPWGTTYAPNLRLTAASMDEDQWVETLTHRAFRPPMPGYTISKFHPADMRALYQYIRQLPGDAGEPAPAALPPSPTPPEGPYYDYMHGGPPPGAQTPPVSPPT